MRIKCCFARFEQKTCILVIFCVCRLSPGIFNYACPNFRNTCVNGTDVYTLNSMSLISQRFFQFHPTNMLVAYVYSKALLLFFFLTESVVIVRPRAGFPSSDTPPKQNNRLRACVVTRRA